MNWSNLIKNLIASTSHIRRLLIQITDFLLLLTTSLAVMSMIYRFGFNISPNIKNDLTILYHITFYVIFFALIIRIILDEIRHAKRSVIRAEYTIFIVTLLIFLFHLYGFYLPDFFQPLFKLSQSGFLIDLIIIAVFIIEFSKISMHIFKGNINPALLFISSFVFIILIGAGLLLLPKSTYNGISFVDALFTSTSAVCVTGLSSVDFANVFTLNGKIITLILIQIGGLGVITFTSFFGLFFMGSGSFKSNLYLKDFISSENITNIFRTLFKIIISTLIIELIGAIIIFIYIDKQLLPAISDQIGFAVFHAVSAFCNAGFSTFSSSLYDIHLRFNYAIHLTIAFLIIMGGIGFPIIINYYNLFKHYFKNKFNQIFRNQSKYYYIPRIININTKIVLITTLILLFIGTIIIFFVEYNNTLKEHSLWGKLVVSFFCSVTPRTAGFNVVNMDQIFPATILISIFLMWIGASPASTGGGIKTTTFAVAIMNIFSFAKGKDRIEVYRRQIAESTIDKALAIIMLSLIVIGIGVFIISILEPNKDLIKITFECFSAFGTVGLSLNFTQTLSSESKYVLIVLMLLGRVGTLTLVVAFIRKVVSLNYKYPQEEILIG